MFATRYSNVPLQKWESNTLFQEEILKLQYNEESSNHLQTQS